MNVAVLIGTALIAASLVTPQPFIEDISGVDEKISYGVLTSLDHSLPRDMPDHNQGDPRWGNVSYAGGIVTSKGCGLCCASMSSSYWTRDEVTPDKLVAQLGDSCTTRQAINDVPPLSSGTLSACTGIVGSDPYYDIGQAIADARSGKTVWCSVRGRLVAKHTAVILSCFGLQMGERLVLQDHGNLGIARANGLKKNFATFQAGST